MDKQFLKKITCQSPEDLPYISALVSEGKIKSGELKYLPKNKIFLLLVERINKEKKENKKIKSIIKFAYIISAKLKNFKFSNNRFITLNAEVIDIELTDQMIANDKDN